MKVLALFSLLTGSLMAGELIEVAEVSTEAVAGSRKVVYEHVAHLVVLHLHSPSLVTTSDVEKVSLTETWGTVEVKLREESAKKFAKKMEKIGRVAVLVNGKVISSPVLNRIPPGGTFDVEFKDAAKAKAFVGEFEKRGK